MVRPLAGDIQQLLTMREEKEELEAPDSLGIEDCSFDDDRDEQSGASASTDMSHVPADGVRRNPALPQVTPMAKKRPLARYKGSVALELTQTRVSKKQNAGTEAVCMSDPYGGSLMS